MVLVALDVRRAPLPLRPTAHAVHAAGADAHGDCVGAEGCLSEAELPAGELARPALRFATAHSGPPQVGVNLGAPGAYLDKIAAATKDLPVTLVFNNAGFMVTGFFDRTPLGKQMANIECNSVSAVQITHLFVTRMLAAQQRGCVVFTSSAAACQPCPFSSLYGATKAFISSFGSSLAVELRSRGVDVCVVHPSPVASRFYDNAHALDSISFFKQFNVEPDALPDLIFAAIGRTVWRDIGGVAVAFRLMIKLLDYNLMATALSRFAPLMGDFQKNLQS